MDGSRELKYATGCLLVEETVRQKADELNYQSGGHPGTLVEHEENKPNSLF